MNINTKDVARMYKQPVGKVLGMNKRPPTQNYGAFGNINRMREKNIKAPVTQTPITKQPVDLKQIGRSRDAVINGFRNLYRIQPLKK